jgi:prevent-host-death family protein
MRSVNITELKKHLSTYIGYARQGEEVVIKDRNQPVAKLVPFSTEDATEEELLLVATGEMRLPKAPLDHKAFWKIPGANIPTEKLIELISKERDEE